MWHVCLVVRLKEEPSLETVRNRSASTSPTHNQGPYDTSLSVIPHKKPLKVRLSRSSNASASTSPLRASMVQPAAASLRRPGYRTPLPKAPPPRVTPRLTPALSPLSAQASSALRNLLRQLPGHTPEVVVKVQPAVVRVGGQRPRATSIASAAADRRAPAPSGPAAAVPLSKTATVERETNPSANPRPTASARRPPASPVARRTLRGVAARRTSHSIAACSIAPSHAARLSVPLHTPCVASAPAFERLRIPCLAGGA